MTAEEKDDALENIAMEYEGVVTKSYDKLAKDVFRSTEHRLEMKTECVIRSAYFRATRRYAQWITKQEGIVNETLDVKGLEFKKANFPPVLGEFFKNALVDVLKGATQKEIDDRLKIFKKQILDGTIPLTDLGNATSVKQIGKHQRKPDREGEKFSQFNHVENKAGRKIASTAAVKAANRYHD